MSQNKLITINQEMMEISIDDSGCKNCQGRTNDECTCIYLKNLSDELPSWALTDYNFIHKYPITTQNLLKIQEP
jgi:hypothetical protein